MPMVTNPNRTPQAVFGLTLAQWNLAKTTINAPANTPPAQEIVDEATVRAAVVAVVPAFAGAAGDRAWNQLLVELGMTRL